MCKIILGKGLEEQNSLDQNTDCNNFITTLAVLPYTACTSGKIVHTYVFPFCTARLADWMPQGLGIPLTAS